MLDIEYRILEKLYSSDSRCCRCIDILNAFLPESAPHVTGSALHDLVNTGLIGSTSPSRNDIISGSVFLTAQGCIKFQAEMEARQQEKEVRDYRTRKEKREKLTLLLSVFSLIVSICAIVISIVQP